MQDRSFDTLTMKEFIEKARLCEETEYVATSLRDAQNAAFVILWNQYKRKSINHYMNVGQVFGKLVYKDKHFTECMDKLQVRPEVGVVRGARNYCEDFRFVTVVRADTIWVLFENPCRDSNIASVWRYMERMEGFAPVRDLTLLDFCIDMQVEVL